MRLLVSSHAHGRGVTESAPKIKVEQITASQPGDAAWAKRMEELQADALPKIRAIAERWAMTLTGLTAAISLAALLRGPAVFGDLSAGAQTWGKACFFLAAVLALGATALAVAAAQQTSRKVLLPTAGAIQEELDEAVEDAVARLRLSRLLATLAVVAALASAAWLWWGPTEPVEPARDSRSAERLR